MMALGAFAPEMMGESAELGELGEMMTGEAAEAGEAGEMTAAEKSSLADEEGSMEKLEPVTTDTFGVGGNKLPVLGTIKNYRFIHNNRECHTDALVVDVDLGRDS